VQPYGPRHRGGGARIVFLCAVAATFISQAKALDQKRAPNWRRARRIATLSAAVGSVFGVGSLAWPTFGKGYSPGPAYDEMTLALDAVPIALRSHRVDNDMRLGAYLIGAGVHPKMPIPVKMRVPKPRYHPQGLCRLVGGPPWRRREDRPIFASALGMGRNGTRQRGRR
jgi:hypothetical protein